MHRKIMEWVLLVLLLQSCSAAPVTIAPITQQQVVSGVLAIETGAQPVYHLFEHTSGLRVLLWPGARNGASQLWNMVCIEVCAPGWEGGVTRVVVGKGFTMSGAKASEFSEYLQNSGWRELPRTLLPAMGATAEAVGSFLASMAGSLTSFSGFAIAVPVMSVPEELVAPQT